MDRQTDTHPMFAAVFATWLAQADALSALPDAPVVSDEPRPGLLSRAASGLVRSARRLRPRTGSRTRPVPARHRSASGCVPTT